MREILFRGKRLDNGEWVEGFLLKVTIGGESAYLIFGDNFCFDGSDVKALSHALVDPATVGQFTGLLDKHGSRIFEGDVVRYGNRPGYVIFGNGCFSVQDSVTQSHPAIDLVMFQWDVTVIGNVHDNPKLLEGGQT